MTVLGTDTFTDTNGTAITSHTPDVGTAWAAASWHSGTAPEIQGNRLRYPADQFVRKAHYLTMTPASADYSAFFTRYSISENNRVLAGLRMSTAAQTGYFGGFTDQDNAGIFMWSAGSFSSLSTVSCPQASGTFYAEFEVSGSTLKLYVQRASDSQWLTTTPNTFGVPKVACITLTDTTISATGKAGIWAETNQGTPSTYEMDTFGVFDATASAPVLSSPTGTPTGPTQATVGVTSDTAPTATAISYQILPAATAAPSAATIVGTPDGTISTGSAGALTKDVTGLTTNTAVKVHFAQGATSNVVSSASFTPNTLAIAGTALSAQTGVAGSAFVWAGVTPESLLTNAGNGTPGTAWTATAGVGASGVTVNASTGILVAAALGTAGSYTITLQRTDASTVPGAQTVTKTVGLTISGSGAATAVTLSGPSSGTAGSASTNFTVGANGTITGTVVVTPSDSAGGGTFTPTSVSISSGSPTGTFTYTAASAGVKSISVTNGGGLSNPSAVSYTASAPSGATFTSEPLKRNNGTLAASSALDYVRWYNPTTGALVLSKTGLSTNSSGIFSTTDAALSGSTSYALDWKEATGQRRMPIKATA